MKTHLALLVLVSAVFLAGCPGREATAPVRVDEDAARQGVEQLRNEYLDAYRAGDAARVADLFTDNAQISVPDQPPLRGRDAIRSGLEQELTLFGNVTISPQETRTGDGWVVEFGTTTQSWRAERPGGAPEQLRASYAVLLVRAEGDRWRIERLVVSGDQPTPMAPTGQPATQ